MHLDLIIFQSSTANYFPIRNLRRERDLDPRRCDPCWFSRPVHSAVLCHLSFLSSWIELNYRPLLYQRIALPTAPQDVIESGTEFESVCAIKQMVLQTIPFNHSGNPTEFPTCQRTKKPESYDTGSLL